MSKLLRIAVASALTAAAIVAAPIGASSTTPVPKLTGPIPVTADSFPFLAANRTLQPIDLQKAGYVEEEFIVSGAANVYDWAPDGSLTVKTPDAPYATRILVRRPKDPSRFSGQAVVELLNPARRFDWGMMSGYLRDSLIERGDAWVGITMPASAKALQKFNPTRYAALSFANPNPSEACAAGRGGAAPATSDQEDGLRWDMISQVGVALKSKTGLNASALFMTAQGADIQTYLAAIQRHAKLASGKPVYDGFLIKTPSGVGAIRRCAPAVDKTDARQKIESEGVPVMLVVAQGEISEAYQRPDSDDPSDRFRIYEVAGAAHIDKLAYRDMPGFPGSACRYRNTGSGYPGLAIQRALRARNPAAGSSAAQVRSGWRGDESGTVGNQRNGAAQGGTNHHYRRRSVRRCSQSRCRCARRNLHHHYRRTGHLPRTGPHHSL